MSAENGVRDGKESPIRIAISGCCGRMGSLIVAVARVVYSDRFEIVGGIEYPNHPKIGQSLFDGSSVRVTDDLRSTLRQADVLIEFTTPEVSISHTLLAADMKVPIVIGTTGFTAEQFQQLRFLSKSIPIFWSPNMSLGIFIVRRAVVQMVSLMKEFGYRSSGDAHVNITETHHLDKKDKPSGTAKQLADDIAQGFGEPSHLIPIESIRESKVVGCHVVNFSLGNQERITVEHEAIKREVFALGALQWTLIFLRFKEKPGWYLMDDLLHLL